MLCILVTGITGEMGEMSQQTTRITPRIMDSKGLDVFIYFILFIQRIR